MNKAARSIVAEFSVSPLSAITPTVSVVMVVYRTGEELQQSIDCVLGDAMVDELVIVDNGSTPQMAERLRTLGRTDPRVGLIQGHGNVGFATAANMGVAFADLNNDGLADLFIVKGNVSTMPDFATLDPNNLLLQQSDGRFTEVGQQAGVASFKRGRGGMMADLNGDGLLDMVVVNRQDKAQLWRNVGSGTAAKPAPIGHWVQLQLQQEGGNRDAIGAWVEVDLGERVVRQEHTSGGGHASGHLGWMHFGLGPVSEARVRVQWPHGEWGPWQSFKTDDFYLLSREKGLQAWKAP